MTCFDLVTFIIAVVTFVITVIQVIHFFYSRRTSFSLSIELLEQYDMEEVSSYVFTLIVQNKSSAHLSFLYFSVNSYRCDIIPQWVGSRTYVDQKYDLLTAAFPVNLLPHEGKLIRINVNTPLDALSDSRLFDFEIQTAKKMKKFQLYAPDTTGEDFYLRRHISKT